MKYLSKYVLDKIYIQYFDVSDVKHKYLITTST